MDTPSRPGRAPERERRLRTSRHKPGLTSLLRLLGLDIHYHRAAGDVVYYRDEQGRETGVMDFVGGYGLLLLGHAHPDLVSAATHFLNSNRPNHVQGSRRGGADRLADALADRCQMDCCAVLANSGTEAVESALKHAMLESGKRKFLSLDGGFHGKTLGAVQLAGNNAFRQSFAGGGFEVVRVRRNDLSHLEQCFAENTSIAGFVFEPIQGEGGIRPVTAEFLQRAAELCRHHDAALIADECQTGLGRTGHFVTSRALGVEPDYLILSKGLGGGLAKISALLVHRNRYVPDFDLLHTSTFADDEFSCMIALKVLDLLDESLLSACLSKSNKLLTGLVALKERFPEVIADVRGAGLMVGVELQRAPASRSVLRRLLSEDGLLGPVVSAYLLRKHRIRVSPTLSDPFTLRLTPSLLVGEQLIDRLLAAFEQVCRRIDADDMVTLTSTLGHPVGEGWQAARMWTALRSDAHEPTSGSHPPFETNGTPRRRTKVFGFHPGPLHRLRLKASAARVAWLFHLNDGNDALHLESSASKLPFESREAFLERLAPLAPPLVMNPVEIQSRTGESVWLYPILLPMTTGWWKRRMDGRQVQVLRSLVQSGVDTAVALGCTIVSLGQFTSIATRSGTAVTPNTIGVTSGNCYSVSLVRQAVMALERDHQGDWSKSVLGVVGATGNIGQACARILANRFSELLLVGSGTSVSRQRLWSLARSIPNARVGSGLSSLNDARVVVCATNCVEPILGPEHFAPGVVIFDVSIPPAVRPETGLIRPDTTVMAAGIAQLPAGEDLGIPGFPLPPGQVYGCLAEGLLLGLSGIRNPSLTGPVTAENLAMVERLAEQHGFTMAVNGDREVTRVNALEVCSCN